jgi:hypothetical protein
VSWLQQLVLMHVSHALSPDAGVHAPPDEPPWEHACVQGPVPCAHAPKLFVALDGAPHMMPHMMSLPGWAVRQLVQQTQLVSLSHARKVSQQLVFAHLTQASSDASAVQPLIPDEVEALDDELVLEALVVAPVLVPEELVVEPVPVPPPVPVAVVVPAPVPVAVVVPAPAPPIPVAVVVVPLPVAPAPPAAPLPNWMLPPPPQPPPSAAAPRSAAPANPQIQAFCIAGDLQGARRPGSSRRPSGPARCPPASTEAASSRLIARRARGYPPPMRRPALLISTALLLAMGAAGCSTYRSDLDRARAHYSANEYEQALALFRVLEPDLDSFSAAEQAQYAFARGMTDYRLASLVPPGASVSDPKQGFRSNARHWLAVSRAIEKETPGGLAVDERQRLEEALLDLNKDIFGGGDSGADAATPKDVKDAPPKDVPKDAPKGPPPPSRSEIPPD